jgi:hypothetical protein
MLKTRNVTDPLLAVTCFESTSQMPELLVTHEVSPDTAPL